MQNQILVVALVPGRESNVDVEIVETQQRGGDDCDESGVCVDALVGNCDGDVNAPKWSKGAQKGPKWST